ncbi:unnamed protein product [Euphydryas editha]|uniref:Uncharacterized protein n=1 Tax=Euphydryas editha TaxID=104508 RepID=A0AAU9UR60_EUPED|nr:unnamed protein product [Euphydryas editha]
MALLYRATRLKDRADTHVFTFVVTRSATREPDRDVTSKDFCCSHQRWAVAFSRSEASLGVYLVWRGVCEGMRVYVDFTFTLLSRDHFTANEGFSGKQVRFYAGCAAQGRGRCVSLAELNAKFADARGEFQLELSMSRVRTLYSCEIRAPRLDTPPIAFAGFDWSVTATGGVGKEPLALRLVRLSGEGQRCRIRYALALGEGERRIHSGPLECLCDTDGRTPPWTPRPPYRLLHKGVRLMVELVSARALAELSVPVAGRAATCYDRDKQAWVVRCDTHSETVRLHMLYRDVHHVPRNHLRYVSWSAWLVRSAPAPGEPEAEELPGAPFENYYAQESADEGLMMETALRVEDVSRTGCPFLHPGGELHVRLEWSDTYLLFQATYHVYDDLCRLHAYQMRREIAALQAENYSLERQLFSYQKSLAYAQAQAGEPAVAETSGRRSPAERSLSTDTEYA